MASPELLAALEAELEAPVIPEARAFAEMLAARPGVAAILFYGSCLQKETAEGLLDFYVLTDQRQPFGQSRISAAACRMLPPNVYHEKLGDLRAKVAVVDISKFQARMSPRSLDTSFWARFCQPAAIIHAKDDAARAAAVKAVASAVETAAIWASRLSKREGAEAWADLFRATYGAELRPESIERADAIVNASRDRFERLWLLTKSAREEAPQVNAEKEWSKRRKRGKARNVARLLKAAFTFGGGLDYALWKVERHTGRPVPIRPWERRWPWLAAPFVALRLWRERRLR